MAMHCVTTVLEECVIWLDIDARCSKLILVTLATSNGLWSWAFGHACWILNRYGVINGFEVVYGKQYQGRICQFAEPVFAYCKTPQKGNVKWQRMLFLGKDTFILYSGPGILLSRSIRRIASDWKSHLAFFLHFSAPTWNFKAGFGGRLVPTRRSPDPVEVPSTLPLGPVMPSELYDKDAEDVKQKAFEEEKEETEMKGVASKDVNVYKQPVQVVPDATTVQSGPSSSSRPGFHQSNNHCRPL